MLRQVDKQYRIYLLYRDLPEIARHILSKAVDSFLLFAKSTGRSEILPVQGEKKGSDVLNADLPKADFRVEVNHAFRRGVRFPGLGNLAKGSGF